MIHKHHIVPKHRGGSDEPSNIVEVSVNQHIMFHFCEYQLHGNIRDKVAYKGLSGCDDERTDLLREMSKNRMWITDGVNNKMIDKLDKIPSGWYNGVTRDKKWGGGAPKGYKQSPEHIKKRTEKAGQTKSKEFIVIPPDGEPYIYKGKRNFCREMGWAVHKEIRINEVINGSKPHYKGFKFKEYDT